MGILEQKTVMNDKMIDKRMKSKQSSMDMPDEGETLIAPGTPEEEHEAHHAD